MSYSNIGAAYMDKREFDKAMRFFNKALVIDLYIFGKKHPAVSVDYQEFGKLFWRRNNFNKALQYYQKAINSLVLDFDSNNIYVNPILVNINSKIELLDTLTEKAELFENKWKKGNE